MAESKTTTRFCAEWRFKNRKEWADIISDMGLARFNTQAEAEAACRKWRRSFPTTLVRVVKEETTKTTTVIEVKP